MILSDQHIHSACSPDSETPMLEMVRAAWRAGVQYLCFTDHIDLDDCLTGRHKPDCLDPWQCMKESYIPARKAMEGEGGPELRLGVELGEPNHGPELAARLAASPELDLVLGSLHNLRDTPDFYYFRYESEAHCHEVFRRYLEELRELAEMDCFDVMAHIGYPRRYMFRAGFTAELSVEEYGEPLREILQMLIDRGKGIEVNCSGLRQGAGSFPGLPVLRLYRELGGEIITVGSDAHNPAAAFGRATRCSVRRAFAM
jgi:histidinol-phosphatase (PHP family)